MLRKIRNWHLSILVAIVSIFSIFLVQNYVLAQWQNPTAPPGSTANQNLVVNPMVENLNLSGYNLVDTGFTIDPNGSNAINITSSSGAQNGLNAFGSQNGIIGTTNNSLGMGIMGVNTSGGYGGYFAGNVHVTGNLTVAGDAPDGLWNANGSNIYFNTGNVGIGTNAPNKRLHIYNTSENAEIDIQSVSGVGNHWAIYHDSVSNDLKFWQGNDLMIISDSGTVGINTGSPNSTYKLHVEGGADKAIGGEATPTIVGSVGIYGEGYRGVSGEGYYGVYGRSTQSGGVGIYGEDGGVGISAGQFLGDVVIGSLSGSDSDGRNDYLRLDYSSAAPASTDCNSTNETGRLFYVQDKLYVCTGLTGWKYTALIAPK